MRGVNLLDYEVAIKKVEILYFAVGKVDRNVGVGFTNSHRSNDSR